MFSRYSKSGIALALALVLFARSSSAQFAGPGLSWSGSSGASASSFVPSCSVQSVTMSVGETVDVTVWGDPQAPYWVFLSTGTAPCRYAPGILGGLALASPLSVVRSGTLSQLTPCLSCPAGFDRFSVVVPPLPPGTTVALQALSLGAGSPGLTLAVEATVR